MNPITASTAKETFSQTPVSIFKILGSGLAASIPAVFIAAIAVEAVPHVRGLSYFTGLRYAVTTPICILAAIAGAAFYRVLLQRSVRPRVVLALSLFAIALIVLATMALFGGQSLTLAALPAVLSVATVLALLVPRSVEVPRRSRLRIAAIALFSALEIWGAAAAFSSEKAAPRGPAGLAFDIPRNLFDADHKFLTLSNGARIHFVDEGKGEVLLFLHGNPAWSFQWRELISGLRGSYRCVALDYPGFGLSNAPAGYGFTPKEQSLSVEEFVDRLGLRNITLVMQDWGGPIGLGLAGRRPELISRIILGNTWAWPTSASEPRGRFSMIAGGPVGEFIQMNFNGFAYMGLKSGVVHPLPAEVVDTYVNPFRPLNRRGIAAFYPGQILGASSYLGEVETGLGRLHDTKTLIFWGLLDPGFPPSDLQKFEQLFPNHKTIKLPGASHFFFEDAANQMVGEISGFMNSKGRYSEL